MMNPTTSMVSTLSTRFAISERLLRVGRVRVVVVEEEEGYVRA